MPEYVVTGPDGKEYDVTAPEGATEAEIIAQVSSYVSGGVEEPKPITPTAEEPGFFGDVKDLGVQVLSGVPKALGAVTSLGSLVPGVHYVADPLSQGLRSTGEFIDDIGLSDYQKQQNAILSQRIEEAAATVPPMPEDATNMEKAEFFYDHMIAQGGEAAEFISENPGQTLNLIAQTLPHIFAGGAIGKGVKATAAASGLKPISGGTAGAIGEGAVAAGDSISNIVAQDYEGVGTEYSADRLYGVPAGIGTSLISKAGSKINRFDVDTAAVDGITDLVSNATKGSITKSAAKGLAVEGTEEFFQSGQEQMFTNLGQGKEFYEDVGSSAVLGLATGAPLGGGVSAYGQYSMNNAVDRAAEVAQEQDYLAQLEEDNAAAEVEQQEREEAAVQQQAEKEIKARTRREAAQTFTPRKEFVAARQKEATATLEAEITDPTTEIGQRFEEHLNDQNIFDPADIEAASKKFIKAYQKENDNTDAINQEYVTALDSHSKSVEQAKAVLDQNPALMDMDDAAFEVEAANDPQTYGVIRNMRVAARPVDAVETEATTPAEAAVETPAKQTKKQVLTQKAEELLGQTWEEDHPELSALAADGRGLYSRGKNRKSRFEVMLDKIVVEQKAEQTAATEETVATTEEQTTPPVEAQAAPVVQETETAPVQEEETTAPEEIPDTVEAQAVSYATEKLGPNWRTEQPALVEVLNAKEYAGFQSNVDRLAAQQPAPAEAKVEETVASSAPAAETTVETTNETTAQDAVTELFAQPIPDDIKFSPAQKKVFDVIREALAENQMDSIMNKEGSLNPEIIRKKAGLKSRQSAAEAVNGVRKKMAKKYGLTEGQVKAEIAGRKTTSRAEVEPNAEEQALELQELGESMNPLQSVGEGTNRGRSIEDKEFTDNLPEEPIKQQTREELDAARAAFDADLKKERMYPEARATWDKVFEAKVAEDKRIPFDTLDAGTRLEWFAHVLEYNEREIDKESLAFFYDDLRRLFIEDQAQEAQDVRTETADESGPTESQESSQESASPSGEVREAGTGPEQSESSPSGQEQGSVAYVDGKPVTTGKKPVVTVRKSRKVTKKKFSKAAREDDTAGVDPELLLDVLRSKFGARKIGEGRNRIISGPGSIYSPIKVHATPKDAVRALGGTMELTELEEAQAFIDPRDPSVAHFIASNMSASTAEGVIDHEIGVHLGLEALLEESQIATLSTAVEEWGGAEKGSIERTIYEKAMARVAFARATGMHESLADIELVAYAVEEAVNAGVKPSADTQNRVAKWLNSVGIFFLRLKKKVLKALLSESDTADLTITPEELVALARAAARVAMRPIYEDGANQYENDKQTIMAFYAGVDKKRPLNADAELTFNKSDFFNPQGQEQFKWGKDSAYGPYSNIKTFAVTNDVDGLIRFDVHVMNDKGEVVTTVGLSEHLEYPNVYVMTVWGPANGGANATQTKDVSGLNWNRLEGVTHGQNMKLLTEARRRLTRYNKGVVPNIVFSRVTGAAAKNSDDGRQGVVYMDDVRKRFSKKEQEKADTALGRTLGPVNAAQLISNLRQVIKSPLSVLKPMSRVVRDNKEALPEAGTFLETLYLQEQTIQEQLLRVEEILMATRELTAKQLTAMNDFIAKSTFEQKWGYDPQIEGLEVTLDPVLKRQFARLDPRAQEVVKRIFAYSAEMRETMQEVAKENDVKGVFEASKLQGPYAPLKRFGDYVAVLRSQQLIDLEKQVKQNPEDKKLAKQLDELMSQEEHYVVSFFDTIGAATKFKEENKSKYAGAYVSEKAVGEFENRVTNPQAFASVMAAIGADDTAGMDATTRNNVKKIVEKLFYETLDEQNARLSGIKRKNRAGFDKDMVRAFVSHAQSQARLLAQLKHGGALSQAMRDMQTAVQGQTREDLQAVVNVLHKKYNNLLTRDERNFAALQDSITSFNSMYMLTTNVAYHVANATQPAISVAKIAGDFGDYSGAWGKLTIGYKEAKAVVDSSILKQLGTITTLGVMDLGNTVVLDVDSAKPEHRALLKKLQLRQMLDVGLEQDLNMETMFDTGYDSINTASEAFKNMSHRLYQSSRFVEAYNRVAVAVAAYDMATQNRYKLSRLGMTAEEYAISIVEDTQGNYGNIDAPLAIDWLPKVTTQFRKFQIIMGWLWGSTVRDAFSNADAYQKAAARRTLGYLGAHVSALAGVRGVPFVGFIGTMALMALGEDEDEPVDFERWIRSNVEDEALADVLLMGLPSVVGVDLSAKLQQRDIFLPLNPDYIDTAPDSEPTKNIAYNLAFGPTAGVIGNIDRAYDQYERGDLSRAAEYLLPRGQRSILETLRYSQEGVQKKNGDVMLDPRHVDIQDLMLNALGLNPKEVSRLKWSYGQQIELRKYFTSEQSKLKREYSEARAEKDTAAKKRIREEWRDLQKQKVRVRPFFNDDPKGLPRTSIEELLKTDIRQRRRERKLQKQLGTRDG
jgi:hypothetical protein